MLRYEYSLTVRSFCPENRARSFLRNVGDHLQYSVASHNRSRKKKIYALNPLNAELNPICHLLALLGAHHIFHISGLRVNICYPSRKTKITEQRWSISWRTKDQLDVTILFHLLCAQHVSDINISIIRSLRLCCWITTSVVLFCKDGWFSVSVNLRCIVVCLVWCVCRFVVVGRRILIDIDRYLLCFVIIVNLP